MATFEQLNASIDKVKKSENITRVELGKLSRDILSYLVETEDCRPVNRLLSNEDGFILTAVNWRMACLYFHHFLPFTSNYQDIAKSITKGERRTTGLLFKKKSGKKWGGKVEEIQAWLAIEENDLWVWSAGVAMEEKPTDWAKRITDTVTKASDKGGMSAIDIMAAVMAAGIDADVLIASIQEAMQEEPEAEAA